MKNFDLCVVPVDISVDAGEGVSDTAGFCFEAGKVSVGLECIILEMARCRESISCSFADNLFVAGADDDAGRYPVGDIVDADADVLREDDEDL